MAIMGRIFGTFFDGLRLVGTVAEVVLIFDMSFGGSMLAATARLWAAAFRFLPPAASAGAYSFLVRQRAAGWDGGMFFDGSMLAAAARLEGDAACGGEDGGHYGTHLRHVLRRVAAGRDGGRDGTHLRHDKRHARVGVGAPDPHRRSLRGSRS